MKTVPSRAGEIAGRARVAAEQVGASSGDDRARLLTRLADALIAQAPLLIDANARDVDLAADTRPALRDRLLLTERRLRDVAEGVRQVARLDDPIGAITSLKRRPNGMLVGRMQIPIGVILMIYEARPNVTVDAAALCLKAGNAVILRGGRESVHTNEALAGIFAGAGLPPDAVQIVTDPDHAVVIELLRQDGIDLVIPRGGEQLIRTVEDNARMPVLKHFKGVCHLYVDESADPAMATALAVNAKTQRPSTCNALETLLVERSIASAWLPSAVDALRAAHVEVRGCEEAVRLCPGITPATEDDWYAEYLDYILSVRVVDGLPAAVAHIHRYGSGLADAIVTQHHGRAMEFVRAVDSAAVLVNASTRLVDGEAFGLGAEIGISTSRIGPRGPIGVSDLTTTKWVVLGTGQLRT